MPSLDDRLFTAVDLVHGPTSPCAKQPRQFLRKSASWDRNPSWDRNRREGAECDNPVTKCNIARVI